VRTHSLACRALILTAHESPPTSPTQLHLPRRTVYVLMMNSHAFAGFEIFVLFVIFTNSY
jgi:hypothetical protein